MTESSRLFGAHSSRCPALGQTRVCEIVVDYHGSVIYPPRCVIRGPAGGRARGREIMTKVEPIDASASEWPQRDAVGPVDLIDPLLNTVPAKAGAFAANVATVPDQRRPGRLDRVSPALIPLLRDPALCVDSASSVGTASYDDSDPRAPARGIVVGLLLSVPLWALFGLGIWFII
jgi:hypothetical protein